MTLKQVQGSRAPLCLLPVLLNLQESQALVIAVKVKNER